MRFVRLQRHRYLAVLFAALLLACNALLTAHAFGDGHAVTDGCEICHQFEHQSHAPAGSLPPPADLARHVLPAESLPLAQDSAPTRSFQARAPPHA